MQLWYTLSIGLEAKKKKERKKSPNVTDNLFEVQIKYIFKCHLPLLDHVGMFKEY